MGSRRQQQLTGMECLVGPLLRQKRQQGLEINGILKTSSLLPTPLPTFGCTIGPAPAYIRPDQPRTPATSYCPATKWARIKIANVGRRSPSKPPLCLVPFPKPTGAVMTKNPDAGADKGAIIPVGDSPHAPFIFYEGASTFDHVNGVIIITLSATRTWAGPEGVVSEQVVMAYLRGNIRAALNLRGLSGQGIAFGGSSAGGSEKLNATFSYSAWLKARRSLKNRGDIILIARFSSPSIQPLSNHFFARSRTPHPGMRR